MFFLSSLNGYLGEKAHDTIIERIKTLTLRIKTLKE